MELYTAIDSQQSTLSNRRSTRKQAPPVFGARGDLNQGGPPEGTRQCVVPPHVLHVPAATRLENVLSEVTNASVG